MPQCSRAEEGVVDTTVSAGTADEGAAAEGDTRRSLEGEEPAVLKALMRTRTYVDDLKKKGRAVQMGCEIWFSSRASDD